MDTINRYLKWDNDVIGIINENNNVTFIAPNYNKVIALYTNGCNEWSPDEWSEFLSERIVNHNRRDIERIMFRMGLSKYDVLRIAEITRAIHPKDLLWIARSQKEKLSEAMTEVFSSVFKKRIDLIGSSVDSPEGYNIKRYGVYEGEYGIYKHRISPLHTDVESEVAVSLLASKLGVSACPAVKTEKDVVFSTFLFDFSSEYIVHFRRLFDGARSDNEYRNLVSVRPQYRDEVARMILLDFITRQDDRHLSNIAIKVSVDNESFYPLYDNGRSLFYEDTKELVVQAVNDPTKYATAFGYAGTYWDYVQEIASERGGLDGLIDMDINENEIKDILSKSGFIGYRFDGAFKWIYKTLDIVRSLG
ncbi:MAG: hypothetical protein LBD23_17925 [Oscillospiraceae bacterium]|jgi:hypothetical protein|nr:hypothetical protein [Oscillospiraceae bacterium]